MELKKDASRAIYDAIQAAHILHLS